MPTSTFITTPPWTHSAVTGIWGHFGHVPPLVPPQHPDAARTWGQAARLIFSKVHGQGEVGTFLAPNPSVLVHWDSRQRVQLSTHFEKDSCPFITSRQLSNTLRMETHGGSGLDSPSPPPKPLFGDVIPLLSPRAGTQGFWSWDLKRETLPPKTPPSLFTSLWSQLRNAGELARPLSRTGQN